MLRYIIFFAAIWLTYRFVKRKLRNFLASNAAMMFPPENPQKPNIEEAQWEEIPIEKTKKN
jgi:hypothetical protein